MIPLKDILSLMTDGANAEIHINLGEARIRPPLLTGAPRKAEWQGVEGRRDNLDVYFATDVIPFLKTDLKTRGSRNEAAGFLFGRYCVDSETGRHFTQVTGYHAFPDDPVHQPTSISVTITPDAYSYQLNYLENNLRTNDPTLEIVGWAHSHPGHGVFLSSSDDVVNEYYKDHPGQLAVVYDPTRDQRDNLAIFSRGGSAQPNEIPNVRQTEFGVGFRRHRGFFTYRKEGSGIKIDVQDPPVTTQYLKIEEKDLSPETPPIRITVDEVRKKGLRNFLQKEKNKLLKRS